ncbi:GNAT family N-acetyltransferase [Acidiphilium sp. PA]|uniref:GNAT family N-acetyltransferase n=1 Tax=Acidiphilium sp. PA TaxID=2871705 RepID=UPI002244DBDD|nr:GNAT family N-acetyltransferase [Acidiphilium sp. PA]MCW8307263.1 GNAT family N-acetyltransferase [Acidiphilium sp. PA]
MSETASRLQAALAVPGEHATVIDMARTFHTEDGHPMDAAAEAAMLASIHGHTDAALAPTYVLRLNGATVGFFVLSLGYSPEHGGMDAFIDDIYLRPAVRGQGLGREAVVCALAAARARGVRVMMLEVEKHNDRAYQLYASVGFVDTERRLMRRYL